VPAHSSPSGNPRNLFIAIKAVSVGLLIALIPANIWPIFLFKLPVPVAAIAEIIFLSLYIVWASGGGPPRKLQAARALAFRTGKLTRQQWIWGLTAAVFFALTVHSSITLLFRFVPYPVAAFRYGYDLSFIPTTFLKWVAIVLSAASAGICEETGFRGYMQHPLEERQGVFTAVAISSVLFMAVHLSKTWASPAMVPIVLGAGVLLGLIAWSANSLVPVMIGHTIMDIGLFAYWWSGVAGTFAVPPVSETGIDQVFVIAGGLFAVSLSIVLLAIWKLRQIAPAGNLAKAKAVFG
jgi:membrane protease YdiL (CAAX protease family)